MGGQAVSARGTQGTNSETPRARGAAFRIATSQTAALLCHRQQRVDAAGRQGGHERSRLGRWAGTALVRPALPAFPAGAPRRTQPGTHPGRRGPPGRAEPAPRLAPHRDAQRVEELCAKNHQLREQQKALKENVRVLENR